MRSQPTDQRALGFSKEEGKPSTLFSHLYPQTKIGVKGKRLEGEAKSLDCSFEGKPCLALSLLEGLASF